MTDLPLPLDALHRSLGARMVSFAGYAMPIQYDGIIAEHVWTRTHAGLFDVSHMGQLLFPLAADVGLEGLLPGDIAGLRDGVLRYSLLLNDDGGIQDDLMVTRRAGDLYMVVNGATKHDDIAVFAAAGLVPEYRDDWALLALQGPEAVTVLERLAPGVAERSNWTASPRGSAAPAIPARMGSKFRCLLPRSRRWRGRCWPRPRSGRSGSVHATRCGSRPGCRCTGTT
jgi:glycine cleavage system aminomethyltransferase T